MVLICPAVGVLLSVVLGCLNLYIRELIPSSAQIYCDYILIGLLFIMALGLIICPKLLKRKMESEKIREDKDSLLVDYEKREDDRII